MAEATLFHAHLDECERCRTQPFNLCARGAVLLRQAFDATLAIMQRERQP